MNPDRQARGLIIFVVGIYSPQTDALYEPEYFGPNKATEANALFNMLKNSADAEGLRVRMLTIDGRLATLVPTSSSSASCTKLMCSILEIRDEAGPPLTYEPEDDDADVLH